MGTKRNTNRIFVGNQEGRPRQRWDNIKTDIGEIGWDGMDLTELGVDRDH
jgi:hypothetical protein